MEKNILIVGEGIHPEISLLLFWRYLASDGGKLFLMMNKRTVSSNYQEYKTYNG